MTGTIAAWQPFRINVNYKLQNNTVHEGDTTTITLPAQTALHQVCRAGMIFAHLRLMTETDRTGRFADCLRYCNNN